MTPFHQAERGAAGCTRKTGGGLEGSDRHPTQRRAIEAPNVRSILPREGTATARNPHRSRVHSSLAATHPEARDVKAEANVFKEQVQLVIFDLRTSLAPGKAAARLVPRLLWFCSFFKTTSTSKV